MDQEAVVGELGTSEPDGHWTLDLAGRWETVQVYHHLGRPTLFVSDAEGKSVAVSITEDECGAVARALLRQTDTAPTYEDVWRAISDLRDKAPRDPLDTATDEIVDMLIDRGWLTVRQDPELHDG